MTRIETHFWIAGILQWLVAASNLFAARIFRYRENLTKVTPFVREVFMVQNLYIMATVAMFGVLCIAFGPSWRCLLGRFLSGFLAIFWGGRIIVQLFFYDKDVKRSGRSPILCSCRRSSTSPVCSRRPAWVSGAERSVCEDQRALARPGRRRGGRSARSRRRELVDPARAGLGRRRRQAPAAHAPGVLDLRRLHLDDQPLLWTCLGVCTRALARAHASRRRGLRLHRRLLGGAS